MKVELDDDAQVEGVRNAFTAAGAVDIDECIESWRVQGSAVGDAFAMKPSPMAKDLAEDVIPVLQEELSVGKRYAELRPAQMPVAALVRQCGPEVVLQRPFSSVLRFEPDQQSCRDHGALLDC